MEKKSKTLFLMNKTAYQLITYHSLKNILQV